MIAKNNVIIVTSNLLQCNLYNNKERKLVMKNIIICIILEKVILKF